MQQKNYNIIGVMSGTSLDGIDLAYVNIVIGEDISATILVAETVPYTCLLYTSPSPRDKRQSRMPSSA